MLLLPGFIAASTSMIGLTRILHPRVYDASVYMLDSAFTGSPSFAIAAAVSGLPYLKGLLIIVYMHLPAAAACIFALVNGGRVKSHTDTRCIRLGRPRRFYPLPRRSRRGADLFLPVRFPLAATFTGEDEVTAVSCNT